jgi:hypothetical protein
MGGGSGQHLLYGFGLVELEAPASVGCPLNGIGESMQRRDGIPFYRKILRPYQFESEYCVQQPCNT